MHINSSLGQRTLPAALPGRPPLGAALGERQRILQTSLRVESTLGSRVL